MNFVIRVELHGHSHDSPAYARLHGAMEARNASRSIMGDTGVRYALPSATYAYSGAYSASAVRDWVKAIVDGLGYSAWILVTGGDSSWMLQAS